jgi:hypothetical protein
VPIGAVRVFWAYDGYVAGTAVQVSGTTGKSRPTAVGDNDAAMQPVRSTLCMLSRYISGWLFTIDLTLDGQYARLL